MKIFQKLQEIVNSDFNSYLETIQDSKKQDVQNIFNNGLKGASIKISNKLGEGGEALTSSEDSKVIYLGTCITFTQGKKIVKCDIGLVNNKFYFLVS